MGIKALCVRNCWDGTERMYYKEGEIYVFPDDSRLKVMEKKFVVIGDGETAKGKINDKEARAALVTEAEDLGIKNLDKIKDLPIDQLQKVVDDAKAAAKENKE